MLVKLSELQPGDGIVTTREWGCLSSGVTRIVQRDDGGLYVVCGAGQHYLDGQLGEFDDPDELAGLDRA